MSLKWRILAVATFILFAQWLHLATWATVVITLIIFIEPEERWHELLEAIRNSKTEIKPVEHLPGKPEVVVVRMPAKDAKKEVCRCGIPGCLGHEETGNDGPIPYFTSEIVLARAVQRGAKIIRFDREISHVEPGDKPSH